MSFTRTSKICPWEIVQYLGQNQKSFNDFSNGFQVSFGRIATMFAVPEYGPCVRQCGVYQQDPALPGFGDGAALTRAKTK